MHIGVAKHAHVFLFNARKVAAASMLVQGSTYPTVAMESIVTEKRGEHKLTISAWFINTNSAYGLSKIHPVESTGSGSGSLDLRGMVQTRSR